MDLVSQNLLMTSGGKTDPTYLEDVFSTYIYEGNQTARAISNGIKLGNTNAGNSVYFDGTGDYLLTNSSSDFTFGTGDFTVEHWMYTSFAGTQQIIDARDYGASGDSNWSTSITSSNEYRVFAVEPGTSAAIRITNNTTLSANTWYHIAIVRSSGTTKMYIDGVQQSQTWADANDYNNTTLTFGIHGPNHSSFPFNGNLSNVRITKGQALYTSNFTPSTQALTTTSQGATASNVKLLCCNANTLTASSGTITSHGNVLAREFGPFTASDGKGGMVWIKNRVGSWGNNIFDTERGPGKILRANNGNAYSQASFTLNAFNNGGFGLGNDSMTNANGGTTVSWSFRKAKGFFDVVTYTGNGSNRTIAHSLASVPGCIMIKAIDASTDWYVWHKGLEDPKLNRLKLNSTVAQAQNVTYWNQTLPTSTNFSLGTYGDTNGSGTEYVAYLFAGGESTAATAPSLSFDGSNDYLQVASSSDFAYGTGDFTWECWAKSTSNPAERILISNGTDYGYIGIYSQSGRTSVQYIGKGTTPHLQSDGFSVARNQWFHVAVSRNSGTSRLFLNGQLCNTPQADTSDYSAGVVDIGRSSTSPPNYWDGNISNVRIVKGTGLYTSSFTPSTEPLKNVSGTVLLCCNDSSPTGSTITPETITNNGATASTDTPFDDPAGYKFGEEGDQNIIKCGKITTDTTNGSYLDLPWEPQYLLFKQANANTNWTILDSMRGWTNDGVDQMINPNTSSAESSGSGYEELVGRTIRFQGYGNNYDFIYMAIRAPESLVSKLPEVGIDVFAMSNTPNGSTTTPAFTSGFPVEFAMYKNVTHTSGWYQGARIIGKGELKTSSNAAAGNMNWFTWDSNEGWGVSFSANQSWMWRRYAGFETIPYVGNGQTNRQVKHTLGRVPEMIWVKNLDQIEGWRVYHKGLNGGTNPEQYRIILNLNSAESSSSTAWNNTSPTSSAFTLGNDNAVNQNGQDILAFLFASVEGISKCGYYTGNGTSDADTQTITTGFQPRFIIIKDTGANEHWTTFDTTRGWASGLSSPALELNNNDAQYTYMGDIGHPISTGFIIEEDYAPLNMNGHNYIYYAHA